MEFSIKSVNYAVFALFVSISTASISLSFMLIDLPVYLSPYYCYTIVTNEKFVLETLGYEPTTAGYRISSKRPISDDSEHLPIPEDTIERKRMDYSQTDNNDTVKRSNDLGTENLLNKQKIPTNSPPEILSFHAKLNSTTTYCDHDEIARRVGILAGLGPLVSLILNPLARLLVKWLGRKYGYILGALLTMVGVMFWIVVEEEWGLYIGRSIHSFGISVTYIGGLANLAALFPLDSDRIKASSTSYIGMSVGYLIGYSPGALLSQYCGKTIAFSVVLAVCFVDLILRFLVPTGDEKNDETNKERRKKNYRNILDWWVLAVVYLNLIAYSVRGLTLATVPSWLGHTGHAQPWQIGVAYTCATFAEVLVQFIFTRTVKTHSTRCHVIAFSSLLNTIGLAMFPFVPNVWLAIIPLSLVRVAEGVYGGMSMSLQSQVADMRCQGDYNQIYGYFVLAWSAAFGLVPILVGYLYPVMGFTSIYVTSAVIPLVSVVLAYRMKAMPAKEPLLLESNDEDP